MFNKIFLTAAIIGLSTSFADQGSHASYDQEAKVSQVYPGGFTLGMAINNEADSSFAEYLTWGYIGDCFLFNIGANYTHENDRSWGIKEDAVLFSGQLGLRNRLCGNLFFTYGVSGNTIIKKHPSYYNVGVFTGLDLQISRHFLLSGKINPFAYIRIKGGDKVYRAFSQGSIGLAYVF